MNRLNPAKRAQVIGTRGAPTAYALMHDLAGRLNHRIQLTTDRQESEARCSLAESMDRTIPMSGNPKARDISTSFAKRNEEKVPKNSEASLAAGLAPEFRRTRGDKLVVLDYGAHNCVSRKLTKTVFDLIMSASA